jgi:2',3'-cyclic-nucleotide 2'-phosphodiesterase (5'-nucleotidase family)
VAEQRKAARNLMLLDAGDAWVGGGELGDLTKGKVIVEAMNYVGYDAMALGPRELTLGVDTLSARLKETDFPVVSANVVRSDTGRPIVPAYTFIDRGGHRIAVIGLTRPETPAPAGFEIGAPLPALQKALAEVQRQTSAIILLTNIDLDEAQKLVQQVPDVDLVVGSPGEYAPDHAIQVPGTGALAVTAEKPSPRHTGRRVGRLQVTLGADGNLTDPQWTTQALDDSFSDDGGMNRLLEPYDIQ